jgi:hypothetical protein
MREHELSSDESVAIFHQAAAEDLFETLDKKTELQRQFLSRLHDALESTTPGTFVEKPYTGVDNVQQFRAGDVMRGYCVFTDDLPSYNVFFFLAVTDHDYDAYPLAKYDRRAGTVIAELRDLTDKSVVEEYLDGHDALDAEDVEALLEGL